MTLLPDMKDHNDSRLSKFSYIYEKYKKTMYAVAYNISQNSYDAEDIVEESLIKVLAILNDIALEDIDKPKGKNLMITITKNAAIDYQRKSKMSPVPYEYIDTQMVEKGAEELYFENENYQEVITCIASLDEKYRDVLSLKVLRGLDSKAIGKILNLSESGVNMRFLRAKQIISNHLEKRSAK